MAQVRVYIIRIHTMTKVTNTRNTAQSNSTTGTAKDHFINFHTAEGVKIGYMTIDGNTSMIELCQEFDDYAQHYFGNANLLVTYTQRGVSKAVTTSKEDLRAAYLASKA